jgi:hypothetical protein
VIVGAAVTAITIARAAMPLLALVGSIATLIT